MSIESFKRITFNFMGLINKRHLHYYKGRCIIFLLYTIQSQSPNSLQPTSQFYSNSHVVVSLPKFPFNQMIMRSYKVYILSKSNHFQTYFIFKY